MQWEDDRGTWHTYGYNDCRQLEGAFLAGETETALTSGASRAAVTVNLGSSHEIRSHIAHLILPISRKVFPQASVALPA